MSALQSSDASLAGSETARAEASALYEHYGARVHTFCLGRLGDREEAADAVQDTFANAWIALRDGCTVRRPLPWLLTIAGNVCASRYRARSARPVETPLYDDAEATVTYVPRAELAGLSGAVRALPEGQRRAFVLRELRGCTYGEIGLTLGVSHSSVAALLHRSRRSIAASLGGAGRRVLVVFPLPGVFRSAFEGGAATFAATAAGTVLLIAPQLGTAPPQRSSQPPSAAGTQIAAAVPLTAEAVAMRGTLATPSAENRVAVMPPASESDAASPLTATDPGSAPPDIGGATTVGDDDTALPEASPSRQSPAASATDSQQPPATAEPPLVPQSQAQPDATVVTPVTPAEVSRALAIVPETQSPVSPSSEVPVSGPPPHAKGDPGPPADPGAQGNGPPAHANGDPGPPTDPGSQGKTPPGQPGNR